MNLAIINARMQSKRLPGKLMQELWEGKSVLEMFLLRMKTVQSWDGMVLAIQDEPENSPLVEVAERLKVPVYFCRLPKLESDAEDVLGRTKECAEHFHANTIIRVTPDNPALHRDLIHRACITYYQNRNACHYVTNCWHRGVGGGGFPRGMEVEVFSFAALGQMCDVTKTGGEHASEYDREHVTTWMRRFPRLLGHADIVPATAAGGNTQIGLVYTKESPSVRLTLDYPEDLTVLRNVFKELQPKRSEKEGYFNLTDIAELFEGVEARGNRPGQAAKPELFEANKHIEQWG